MLSLYVPPSLTAQQLNEVIDYIIISTDEALSQTAECNLIIAGDLNTLPTIDLEQTLGVIQLVDSPTRGSSILDKILIDQDLAANFHTPNVGPNFGKADHLSVLLEPLTKIDMEPSRLVKVYDYRQSNINSFLKSLSLQRWQDLYLSQDAIDEKCAMFYSMVNNALNEIPFTYVEMSKNEKPWMSPKLKLLINLRYEAYRMKQFQKFAHLKEKIKQEIKKAKGIWLSNLKRQPQGIWKAVQNSSNFKRIKANIINDGSPLSVTANRINEAFADAFSASSLTQFDDSKITGRQEWKPLCDQSVIGSLLTKLKDGKAAGNDNLTPRLLKAARDIIVSPLTHLCAISLSSCSVPECWKTAHVVPIPKKGCSTITDFRPISLLPIPSKILERIVLSSVQESLIKQYGSNQFGFRPGSSTLLAHITIHEYVTRQLDSPSTLGVALVTFDMRKAFDSLSHDSLLQSLAEGGLPSDFISWIKSFLHSRKQKVLLNGELSSSTVNVTSGVPQGSVLAPYLFACHMGSLTVDSPDSQIIKYADDVTFLCPYKHGNSMEAITESKMIHMKSWCSNHGLSLNEDKTKILLFKKPRINYSSLDPFICNSCVSSNLNILGVTFSSNLDWDAHVDRITKSASRRIHVLRRIKSFPSVSKKDLLRVYEGFILSTLEYNAPLFTGISKKNGEKLEKIRKRCHRIICGLNCSCDDFPALSDRRSTQALNTFASLQDPGNLIHSLLPKRLPRSQHFCLDSMRSERRIRSFIPFCCIKWNHNISR